MAKLYLVNDRNKARTWSFQLPNGKVVTLYANRWVASDEDLSEYVRSGFVVCKDTDADVAPVAAPPAPVAAPVVAAVPRDPMSAFAAALGNAFAKPAPAVPEVVAPAPVVAEEAVVAEPVDAEVQPIAQDAAVEDDAQEAYASMTRNALWVLATERGLADGLDYRATTKAQLVRLLADNLGG